MLFRSFCPAELPDACTGILVSGRGGSPCPVLSDAPGRDARDASFGAVLRGAIFRLDKRSGKRAIPPVPPFHRTVRWPPDGGLPSLFVLPFLSCSAGLRALCARRHMASSAAYSACSVFEEKRGFQSRYQVRMPGIRRGRRTGSSSGSLWQRTSSSNTAEVLSVFFGAS